MHERIRYRTFEDYDGQHLRRRVVVRNGFEGYIERWTDDCSGCTEQGEYGGMLYGPFGCEECGYTGRRRTAVWIPFPDHAVAYERWRDQRWERRERLLHFFRSRRAVA